MKRVRCPKCDSFITFDETKYEIGKSLVFECPDCHKQFGIKLGTAKLRNTQKEEHPEEEIGKGHYGEIVVLENVFHYKQVIPLQLGLNTIGRYMKGSKTTAPIETNDPSMDMLHCKILVSSKKGRLTYTLCDGPSNTGTFVDNEILQDKERRVISDGALFTIGATSIILKTPEE